MGSAEVSMDVQSMWSEMDTKIHRFPAGLRGIDYPYIVPRLVAIGPYHRVREHLRMMEVVKEEAVRYFSWRTGVDANDMRKAIRHSVVDEGARGKYIEDTATKGMTGDNFADMMLRDACFLLVYMDAYSESLGEGDSPKENPFPLRRFLFSNRDSIENDIMLLENQLPWPVIKALIDLVSPQDHNNDWLNVVSCYIITMGNTFKVGAKLSPSKETYYHDLKIGTEPPPHLLALFRRHKIEVPPATRPPKPKAKPLLPSCFRTTRPPKPKDTSSPSGNYNTQPQKLLLLTLLPKYTPKDTSISAITPMELEEIGVKLIPNGTDAFSDIGFAKGHLLHLSLFELSLTPLSLSGPRASCLVNMAAFEVCTTSRFQEDPNKTAICSYLALLGMFMVREDDVHKLRSQGLLHGPQSNMEMLTFFNTVTKHLPDNGSHFRHIMLKIAEYKNNSYSAKAYELVYNNLMTIIKLVSILATLISFYKAVMSLNNKK